MRFSCNGCRVLRKGCSEDCSIRPCLEWIKSPEAQANATLFLAKFYGRAGLLNLIDAGPDHLRPSIFRSLLNEACGRIVNPIFGSAGLISTGSWHLCEAAVEAVLSGRPVAQIPIESAVEDVNPLFKACDIRHVPEKDKKRPTDVNGVKNRTRSKRSKSKSKQVEPVELVTELSVGDSVAHAHSHSVGSDPGSVETVEDTLAKPNDVIVVGLDLSLGFGSIKAHKVTSMQEGCNESDQATLECSLTLGLPKLASY